jgi:hypothetical protein
MRFSVKKSALMSQSWGWRMWLALGVILLILWLGGFFAFHVAGGLIHLLLIIAVIALVYHFITGRRVGV